VWDWPTNRGNVTQRVDLSVAGKDGDADARRDPSVARHSKLEALRVSRRESKLSTPKSGYRQALP